MAKSSTSFKKGETGNPNGRPVGSFSLTGMLRDELQNIPEGEDKKTYAELLVRRVLKMAIVDGNEQMIKLCYNYLEGMPKESHDLFVKEFPHPIYGGKSVQIPTNDGSDQNLLPRKED